MILSEYLVVGPRRFTAKRALNLDHKTGLLEAKRRIVNNVAISLFLPFDIN